MAVGVLLSEMLQHLRAEANISLSPGHNLSQRDAHVMLLRRVQEELWIQHDWPGQIIQRDVTLIVGDRAYSYPSDLAFDRIEGAWIEEGGQWLPLCYGITPDVQSEYSSDNFSSRPTHWEHFTDNISQFQLFPVPDAVRRVRFRGRKKLGPLVEDTDRSTLDGTMIVLYAAAELLADAKSDRAGIVQQKAQAMFNRLKAHGVKSSPIVIGGTNTLRRPRVGLDYIPPGYGSGG